MSSKRHRGDILLVEMCIPPYTWKGHSWFPRFFSLIPILMLIVFHYAQLPKKLRLHTTFLIGMMLLMFATAMFSSTFGLVSALHPVIAVALFFRTMDILRDLKELTGKLTDR